MAFKADIADLLAQTPADLWRLTDLNGIQYHVYPWHGYSAISLRTRRDAPLDSPGDWEHFEVAKHDAPLLSERFSRYEDSDDPQGDYHTILCTAAEALLLTDFTAFGLPRLVRDGALYRPIELRVFDPDCTYSFNYCEYILAKLRDEDSEHVPRDVR